MGPVEILWRLLEGFRIYILFQKWKSNKAWGQYQNIETKKFEFLRSHSRMLPMLEWAPLYGAFDVSSMLEGECQALGYSLKWRCGENSWHIAPDTGNVWPDIFFGSIAYRQGNSYGDARVVWEPSRLQHLLDLSLYLEDKAIENHVEAIALIEDELISWYEQNPPLTGIHYVSAMECALRIITVCYVYDIIRTKLVRRERIEHVVAAIVISHADLIIRRLSLHSSAGNHTIAESAGLIYAGIVFSEYSDAEKWKKRGLELLSSEIDKQILPDGGGVEQTFWYLLFVTDLTGLVAKLLETFQVNSFTNIMHAFLRGRDFLSKFANAPEGLPTIGDSDDGFALSKYLRISFENKYLDNRCYTFPDSGYTLVNSTQKNGSRIIFDHGGLGMQPSYGHGHADALSVTFKYKSKEILIDPGTFTYTGNEIWREYFRSTRAHNTVLVNGLDQAKQESSFLWSRPYVSTLHKLEVLPDNTVMILAYHDGYKSMGIRHWRGVVVYKEDAVVVWDYIEGKGEAECELNWHLGMKCLNVENVYKINIDKDVFNIHIADCEVEIFEGSTMPISGWRSVKYGTKEAISTLSARKCNHLPIEFTTKIYKENVQMDGDKIDILRGWCRGS